MSKVNSAAKVEFQSFDTLFGSSSVEFKRDEFEKVTEIELCELFTYKGHPFRVLDDMKMEETVESIRKYGVLNPALVRPRAGGGYELLSGHRRKRGSELAGLTSMPVIIREISDDEAVIIMVDSNIQREDLLFSEKAFAYKMKNDAMKHQGSKGDKNTADKIAENTGESGRTIQRYIRLTYLINELLELVDQKKLTFGAGVDLSYLKEEEQVWVLENIQANKAYPTPQQAEQLKQYSSQGKLTADIVQLLLDNHKPVLRKVVIKQDRLAGYFENLENQIEYYERTIKARPDYIFVKVYMDQGISGTSENRPGFQEMLEDARNKKLNLILTKSISRFARNTVTVLKYARELKEYGVGIFFEEQNINTLSGEGELMLTVLASFAQEESRSISENNKWSIQKKFQRGEAMITTERFMGYDKAESGNLVINQKEAAIVRRIFELYLEGKGTFTIAKILNVEGLSTITGGKWHDSTIKGMLINEKYKGDLWLQKYYTPEDRKNRTVRNNGNVDSYYIKDNHEAIIFETEWNRAQEIMQQHRQAKGIKDGDTKKYQNRYPLSGLLICPYCKKTLRRAQVYGGKVQWICSTYIKKGKTACQGIRVDDIEVAGRAIKEPTIIEEDYYNGEKHYMYTCAKDYKEREWKASIKETKSSSVLPSVNRPRRAAIKL